MSLDWLLFDLAAELRESPVEMSTLIQSDAKEQKDSMQPHAIMFTASKLCAISRSVAL